MSEDSKAGIAFFVSLAIGVLVASAGLDLLLYLLPKPPSLICVAVPAVAAPFAAGVAATFGVYWILERIFRRPETYGGEPWEK